MRNTTGGGAPSDALVLFGVTGDLAHKMIFPALYAMAKRGVLNVPVVGVASPPWSLAQLRERATDGIRNAGRIDDARALRRLLSLLRYVAGDYNDAGTFTALEQASGHARRPAHYLAIPPSLFATVITGLGAAGLAHHARMGGGRSSPEDPPSGPFLHAGELGAQRGGRAHRGGRWLAQPRARRGARVTSLGEQP